MAPTDVTIRIAQRGDLGALGRLGATLLRVHHEFDRARFMAPGHDPEGGSWKELRDEAGFIHDVLVHESARGAGVARALVHAAVEWLQSRGVPRVVLWTAHANEPAQRLFSALGFRPTMIEMTTELSGTNAG